ncbi:hypothetical protein, partial [Mesorhizobium sp. B2-6-7]|uniref:hypothetical protein n=1 Tax=Mesorhizobium sp. B2-6-7 TaxID=2589910 RepID=UPI001AEF1834
VIVFVSLTAGLLSDRAVALLELSSATLLGASEPSEVDRWAVGLKDALVRKGMSVDEAAARLRVEPKVIQDWMDDLQEVSYQQQRDLSLVLGVSPRLLFTDQPPS